MPRPALGPHLGNADAADAVYSCRLFPPMTHALLHFPAGGSPKVALLAFGGRYKHLHDDRNAGLGGLRAALDILGCSYNVW